MFSKLLVKLIDEAIVPAIYLITARVVSLVFIAHLFNIRVSLGSQGFVYNSQADYMLVNSYSLLFMIGALCIGLAHIVVKSVVFHDTHITPPLAAKLFSAKAQHLIQDSFHLYSQGVIWMSYLYFLTIGAWVMSMFDILYTWVVYVAFGLAVLFSYVFIVDVEREILANVPRRK
ncbi:TPA: hypothetical protein DCY43_02750 [candidate division WWE3 bacterium]|uniref:Uncharacterized protein n=3 Tax=Katanobacteria TaxID=422282 RepID=A0A1F4V5H0_UNCKA|nr:MAG: hypothetical protein UW65_C0007G0002 [candidate division WWE3 bacterium GW2011_GWB1_44_4]OGC52427.1 MAG: hypothetical protein A2709_01580 [candidate division WWE3 bacterium RIFCSPHIGHO2_01_FULL_43_9]HAZ29643.1 hypothetical protein [candidate division WWE3 bacterium]